MVAQRGLHRLERRFQAMALVALPLFWSSVSGPLGGLLRHCASDDHVHVIGPAPVSVKPLPSLMPVSFQQYLGTSVVSVVVLLLPHVKTAAC